MAKDWKRIVFFVFVSLGATLSFGYWSLHQFDDALNSLVASTAASIPPIDPRQTVSEISTLASSTPPTDQASSTPLASSTPSTDQASSTPKVSKNRSH